MAEKHGTTPPTHESHCLWPSKEDADFIEAMSSKLPGLLARLDAADAEIARLRPVADAAESVMDDVRDDGVAERWDVAIVALEDALKALKGGAK